MLRSARSWVGRWVLPLSALTFVLASTMLGAPAPASAATAVGESGPRPVNVLPSVIVGGTGSQIADVNTLLMYKFMTDPKFVKALVALQNGNASATQTATVAAEKATYAVPATKAAKLTKTIGGVAAAADIFSDFEFGTMIGAGISRAFGFNDDEVCAEENGVLTAAASFLDGVDCSQATANGLTDEQRNADAAAGYDSALVGKQLCNSSGTCVHWYAIGAVSSTYATAAKAPAGTAQVCGYVDSAAAFSYITVLADGTHVTGVLTGTGWDVTHRGCPALPSGVTDHGSALFPATYNGTATKGVTVTGGTEIDGALESKSGNPERAFDCTITTTDGQTFEAISDSFHETDPLLPEVECPTVPGGLTVGNETVTETGGDTPAELYNQDSTPEYRQAQELYPECSDGTCLLDLKKSTTSTSCFQDPTSCADWYADPNKSSDYSCTYGTHAVDLTECALYAPTFKSGSVGTATEYGDPQTGQEASESPDTRTDNETVLQRLFVPDEATQADVQERIGSAWDASAPAAIIAAVPAYVPPAFDASGCQGPRLAFTIDFWQRTGLPGAANIPAVAYDGFPLSACEDPAATVAWWSRLLSGAALLWFGGWAVVRQVGAIVGARGPGGTE